MDPAACDAGGCDENTRTSTTARTARSIAARIRRIGDDGSMVDERRVAIFGEHEAKTIAQLHDVASRAERAALMADGHLGYVMPIGGVAAYRDQVSVVGVGFDIACGNAAIRTNHVLGSSSDLISRREELADEIQRVLSFGVGRKNLADDAPVDHALFEDPAWEAVPRSARADLRQKARAQL